MRTVKIAAACLVLGLAVPAMARDGGGSHGGGGFHGGGGGFHGGGGGGFRGGAIAPGRSAAIAGGGFRGGQFGGLRAGHIGMGAAAINGGGPRFQGGAFAGRGRPGGAQLAQGGSFRAGHFHHRHGFGPRFGFAAGLAAGSAFGYYGDDAYGNYDQSYALIGDESSSDNSGYCSQRYKSYDPASGTYLGYDGRRHPCP
jgi:hypothetical protein